MFHSNSIPAHPLSAPCSSHALSPGRSAVRTLLHISLCLAAIFGALAPPATADIAPRRNPGPLDEACGNEVPGSFDLPARTQTGSFSPMTNGFAVEIGGDVIPYRLMSIFVLPGQEVEIETVLGSPSSDFQACAQGGTLRRDGERHWTWTAPDAAGEHTMIHLSDLFTGDTQILRVFVMTPYAGQEQIENYRIGRYERLPLYDDPAYEMPDGLLRVTQDMHDLWISPHFQLKQFLCKQTSQGPKYAIVRTRMLLKLEVLLEKVNERGLDALTFAVLSAYRTPHYNRSIGNKTRYSRHGYGDGVDIYVDEDGDGSMDDLTGDGRSDYRDAVWLSRVVEDNRDASWYAPFVGGLGIYGPRPHRGAFVHVDTRGSLARWNSP